MDIQLRKFTSINLNIVEYKAKTIVNKNEKALFKY